MVSTLVSIQQTLLEICHASLVDWQIAQTIDATSPLVPKSIINIVVLLVVYHNLVFYLLFCIVSWFCYINFCRCSWQSALWVHTISSTFRSNSTLRASSHISVPSISSLGYLIIPRVYRVKRGVYLLCTHGLTYGWWHPDHQMIRGVYILSLRDISTERYHTLRLIIFWLWEIILWDQGGWLSKRG